MKISQLKLDNFRSYDEHKFDFDPEVTLIVGKNGTGKTNLLEAIYVLMQGKSFRDSDDLLTRYDQDWWKVVGQIDSDEREIRYQPNIPSPKQLVIGDKKTRFNYRMQLPVVLFEPDDLLMIHGTPGSRRRHLDTILQLVDPGYRNIVSRYDRALLQRNNILKKRPTLSFAADAVFAWDVILAEYGTKIMQKRSQLVAEIADKLGDYYRDISGSNEKIDIIYKPTVEPNSHSMAVKLSKNLENDLVRGSTSIGPHRDDVEHYIRGKTAKNTASRGEVRSLVLALKLFELDHIHSIRGEVPVFLLDDVFSELDTDRQRTVIRPRNMQIVITTTDADHSAGHKIKL